MSRTLTATDHAASGREMPAGTTGPVFGGGSRNAVVARLARFGRAAAGHSSQTGRAEAPGHASAREPGYL